MAPHPDTVVASNFFAVVDCRNLLHQLIEPNPQLRIPLTEVISHPWVTKNGKAPFATYTAPPRNKMLRNQVNTIRLRMRLRFLSAAAAAVVLPRVM